MGQLVTSTNGSPATRIQSYAPGSGRLLGEVAVTTPEQIRAVVLRAKKAQRAWAVLPVEERCQRLQRLRDALVDHAEDLVEVLVAECGKPRVEALQEVTLVADLATYYCREAPRVLAPHELPLHLLKHRRAMMRYAPRGVVGVISPWNFPFVVPMGDVVAALVTGSAAVLKPSEVTPLVAQRAKEIFDATGLPEDLFGVVQGYGAAGQTLIESGIQKLVFTGGVETGRKVAAACGRELVPCVMELGGKAPLLACADTDVERTARAIVYGGFFNSGQACIAVERVYAHRDVHDALVGRVAELTRKLRQGDPETEDVDLGAITFPKQIEVARKHVEDALAKGAELLCGGKSRPGPGQFFEPTVLARCTHDMTVMTEEIFGPVVPFMRVDSDDEAVKWANQSHLGLNAYVFSKDRARAGRLAERIEAGSVLVNDVLSNYACAEAPFGGTKLSGFGRVHGDDALRAMADAQHVNIERFAMPVRDPMWFPYSGKSYRWSLRAMRALFAGGGVVQRIRELL
jgi:succinate-semialdehyde dehydrogenase/glutarate-semialdehyde dehydrogenase